MSRLPTLRPAEIVAALKKAGFFEHHHKGSHLFLRDTDGRMTCVPMHPGDLDRGLLKRILKQAGLSERQFRKLL